MKPKFNHPECPACAFLGHFYGHDVYQHAPSFIARFGDEETQYWSISAEGVAGLFTRTDWVNDPQILATLAAICCSRMGEAPAGIREFDSIAQVKRAVNKLRWDMLFNGDRDIPPSPDDGKDAALAFHHYYQARATLEQAEHQLELARIHEAEHRKALTKENDHVCDQ